MYVFRDIYLVAYAWKVLFSLNHLNVLFQSEVFLLHLLMLCGSHAAL